MATNHTWLLKEALGDEEAGLNSLFEKWNTNAEVYTYELKYDQDNELIVLFTDTTTQQIEVYRLDIKQVV
jgi:hypothetical protein